MLTAKEIKAEAPYAISKYGKEFGTPATRLLFERHSMPLRKICRYAHGQIPNKKLTGTICTFPHMGVESQPFKRLLYPVPSG